MVAREQPMTGGRDCVFVVSAGVGVGFGHVSRCRVLAHELVRQGAPCRFLVSGHDGLTQVSGYPVALLRPECPPQGDTIIVDGYQFDTSFLDACRRRFRKLVLIDDLADRPFPADLVLNHNIYAKQLDYSGYRAARVLAGMEYCLVDRRFFSLRDRPRPRVPRILITLGAGDTALGGLPLAEELCQRLEIGVDVALGAAAPPDMPFPELVRLHVRADLPDLLSQASLVICGLGVTFLEVLASGLPCIGVLVADNQRLMLEAARKLGYTVLARTTTNFVDQVITTMGAARGSAKPRLLDEHGPRRAAAAILAL